MLDKSPVDNPRVTKKFAELGALLGHVPESVVAEETADLDDAVVPENPDFVDASETSDIELERQEYKDITRPQLINLLVRRGQTAKAADTILQQSMDIEFAQDPIDYDAVNRIANNLHKGYVADKDAKDTAVPVISNDSGADSVVPNDPKFIPSATEITAEMNTKAQAEILRPVDETLAKLEATISTLVDDQANDREVDVTQLQKYADALQSLRHKFTTLPEWETDAELLIQQQASIQSRLEVTRQQAAEAMEIVSQNLPSTTMDALLPSSVSTPDAVERKTGWWNSEYQRSQGIATKEPTVESMETDQETIKENPSEEVGETFDFADLEQRYHAVIDSPFVAMTKEERMTLQSVFENYQRIVGDANKSEAVKEQAAANVVLFLEQAAPIPTNPEEVAEKMQHLQTFLNENVTSLPPKDQETVKALTEMYETVTPKDGESEAEYMTRLSKQYQLLEDIVRGFYEDGKLTTDRPLVLTDPIEEATNELSNETDSAVESGGLSANEAVEADFTTAVQRHIHNLRLLLEAEGRGPMFTSVASNGPLKKSDITRWLEVSEKKYTALREKLIDSGVTDLADWADEQIAPFEVKLGWRKKPSMFSKLSTRLWKK